MIAWLLGCGLLANDGPVLLAVNGVEVTPQLGVPMGHPDLAYTPGGDFDVALEVLDREGNDVRVWWPWAPEGWDFDPDETSGVWHVPDDVIAAPPSSIVLLLEDDHPADPKTSSYWVPLWLEGTF